MDVYQALASTKTHPTAEQLHRMVAQTSPGTSLATVYNTLEALCSAGLTRKIATGEGGARYDADLSDHLHAVTVDGRIVDVPDDLGSEVLSALPPDLMVRLQARLGAAIRHVSVQFHAPDSATGR